jgi:hypothetical protein
MIQSLRLTHAHALTLLLALAAAGCDDPKSRDNDELADDTGPQESVPIAIDCSFVFADNQIDVSYEATGTPTETPVGGKLIASGMLTDDAFEGRSFSLTIYAEDSSVLSSALYQMDPTRLPYNEFYGNHGFTGLQSVKDPDAQENVQFACFARDPGDPPKSWD